ncbi:MAG: TonB C-terminal domain-containing protein [Nitrospinaceae bacterium]|nr:TonB C-terminal domain-containing protein [Nitrospinaceae bacterium]
MRAEFSQSIDFNQMFVFSVFGHLVILTIVLFLPKPLQEAKVVVPAFLVSLVETSSGNKIADQKKTVGDRKPAIKKSKPKTKKPVVVKRVAKKQVVKKKSPPKPNKILTALQKLDKKTAAAVPIPATNMFEQFDQLALLESPKKKVAKPKRKNLVLEEALRELEQVKDKKVEIRKEISPKPMPESLLEDFEELKMEEVVKQKEIKKLLDSNELKIDEGKTAKSVAEKRNLLQELDKFAKLKFTENNKGKEQIAEVAVQEKASKPYDSVLEKFKSLTVESFRVTVEVSGAKLEASEFQSSLRALPDSKAVEVPDAKLEVSKFQSSLRALDSPALEVPGVKLGESKFQSSLRALESPVNSSSNSVKEPHVSSDREGALAADIKSLYAGLVQEKIYKNWRDPLAERHSKEAIISFHIFPKGNIDKPFIKQSSGVKVLDTLAVAAVHDSVPFPPFPKDLKMPNLFLSIYFKYVPKND